MLAELGTFFTNETIEKLYGIPFTNGNKVTILWKSKELFHTMFDFVRGAKN